MKFNEFPFVRYTACFIAGVLAYGYWGPLQPRFLMVFVLALWSIFTVSTTIYRPGFRKLYYFFSPALAYGCLFLTGLWVAALHDVHNDPKHIYHQKCISAYLAEVLETDQRKARSFGNLVAITAVETPQGWQVAKGKVQIYHRSEKPLIPGAILHISGAPQSIAPPKNPEAFDYATFMARKQIFFSHFIGNDFKNVGEGKQSIWRHGILNLRLHLEHRIVMYLRDEASIQIAKALLLGQKADLDDEIGDAYATAGAMHILAVSGLHVGIIYGFFFLFIRPQRMKGYKRAVFLGLVVALIWGYAAITGLSPSVLRAATMFTFISMAQIKSRSPSIFNPLALSALVLLVYDPFLVYAVGFQLSYAALLGILLFQPLLSRLWYPQRKWLRYIWDIITVGTAAQLATFPLAIHYFNVFPTYFLLSNILAIPGAFVVMSVGVPFLLFSSFHLLASFLGFLLDSTLQVLNAGIFSLQHLPYAKIEHLYFHLQEMILIWVSLFFLYLLIETRRKSALWIAFVALFLFTGLRIYKSLDKVNQNYLLVYRLDQGMVLDYTYRGQLYTAAWQVVPEDFNYQVLPHRTKVTGPPGKFLLVRDRGEHLVLDLPCGKTLSLDKDTRLPADLNGLQCYLWEGGKWHRFASLNFPQGPPQSAIKISFNNSQASL
ncbi:competence protein ComEC [Cyclobacterium lianum]|uniref:Competence protein ComEC n=1 Tax=Cyclobacterium lianum TaxID=388280 RepID=A0A1M7NCK5_9BACT|nr:ComEC/Rec2 family competence protein [Cyclobacterium lianum]SHN01272.1 competence protein ComEC [Cyclobacterium lianum]